MRAPTERIFLAVALALAATAAAVAGGTPEDSGQAIHVDQDGHAAHGADVVAYFSLEPGDAPVYGSEEYRHEWRGATWLFATAGNLEAFRDDPERYAPEYGGYCAWAMARDKLAPIDPEKWDIVDGDLYLNYSARTQRSWRENQERDIRDADTAWPGWVETLGAAE